MSLGWLLLTGLVAVVTGERQRPAVLSPHFAQRVAHTVHSLTLRQIREFFEPNARASNGIPTLNRNLSSPDVILRNAPDLVTPDTDMWLTGGMRELDLTFSHMHELDWDVKAFNVLERLSHTFHMREMLAAVAVEYHRMSIEKDLPSKQVCDYVRDVEGNGVIDFLHHMLPYFHSSGFPSKLDVGGSNRFMSLKRATRPNKLVSAWDYDYCPEAHCSRRFMSLSQSIRPNRLVSAWDYDYGCDYNPWCSRRFLSAERARRERFLALQRAVRPNKLVSAWDYDYCPEPHCSRRFLSSSKKPAVPRLLDAQSWKAWKKLHKEAMHPEGVKDSAIFLHCMLRDA